MNWQLLKYALCLVPQRKPFTSKMFLVSVKSSSFPLASKKWNSKSELKFTKPCEIDILIEKVPLDEHLYFHF